MVASDPMQLDDTANSPASDFFEEWRTYRKMVDNNYLFHREAYASLRRFLVAEVGRRFLFLDIACGDSTAAVDALKDTQVVAYHGVDFSRHALQLAAPAVAALDCRIALEHGDYVDILRNRTEPTDVAWIGLSLHHLQAAAKQSVMRDIRRIVGDAGALLIYENASPDGEDREGWMRRWDEQRSAWTAYTPEEWRMACEHVHAFDFPETASGWHELGWASGFNRVRELFRAPTDLFRLYAFQA